jgi:hypothetical protein
MTHRSSHVITDAYRSHTMKKHALSEGLIALHRMTGSRKGQPRPRRFLRIRRTAGTAIAVVSAVSCRIAELGEDLARRLSLRDDEQIEVIELSTGATTLTDEMIGAIEAAIRPFLLRGEAIPNLRQLLVTPIA